MSSEPRSLVRHYRHRASYEVQAALSILQASPVCHVAFMHSSRDGTETLMNLPLIAVVAPYEGEEDASDGGLKMDEYVVYLHTHKTSSLVEAAKAGVDILTLTSTIIDGLVFSPIAASHSFNYRSTTLHLHEVTYLHDTNNEPEKRRALSVVVNTSTGYDRISVVGEPAEADVKRTAVVRCRIRSWSSKQRVGGWVGGEPPEGTAGEPTKGVVPCWTQFGDLLGGGNDEEEVRQVLVDRSKANQKSATASALADPEGKIEGLGCGKGQNFSPRLA